MAMTPGPMPHVPVTKRRKVRRLHEVAGAAEAVLDRGGMPARIDPAQERLRGPYKRRRT